MMVTRYNWITEDLAVHLATSHFKDSPVKNNKKNLWHPKRLARWPNRRKRIDSDESRSALSMHLRVVVQYLWGCINFALATGRASRGNHATSYPSYYYVSHLWSPSTPRAFLRSLSSSLRRSSRALRARPPTHAADPAPSYQRPPPRRPPRAWLP